MRTGTILIAALAAILAGPANAAEDGPIRGLECERTGDGGARFMGRTELGEDTRLRLMVHHPQSGYRNWSGPMAVADGNFASDALYDQAFPLPPGLYRVTVMAMGSGEKPEALAQRSVQLGPMSRTGRAVALLDGADFSPDCKYPTAPFRANFDQFFSSGYSLQVEEWRLFVGADDVERLMLVYSFDGVGRAEAIWEVDLSSGNVAHANTEARRLSCL
ncbi:hypothetical protein [Thiohalorhabdus sp.]|uniref:hypothetical protein n=1 Tax=Thiohalorhabdus sp. TaxID=3094134 RepID=UPI002FC2D169